MDPCCITMNVAEVVQKVKESAIRKIADPLNHSMKQELNTE